MTAESIVVDVSRDWAIACDVQRRFMEGSEYAAGALEYSARTRQLQALGGDCYEFRPLGGGRLALTVGDASGKGVAAALMIANAQSSLRTATLFSPESAAEAVTAVNRQVYASSLSDRYATLFYGVFDESTRALRYVNAGHNPPMVFRRDGSAAWLEAGGAPVGMFPDSVYREGVIELDRGDLLLAYTDGIVEATNAAGVEWGVEGLRNATAGRGDGCADQIVQGIFLSMDEFSGGRQTDDATVAVLRVL